VRITVETTPPDPGAPRTAGGTVPLLDVTLVPAPDQVVVRITGDADLSTAPLIADALSRAAALGTRQVVVDVAGVRFWDCSGLHALSTFTADVGAAGRSCRIVGAPAATRRLIRAADLDGRLDLDGPLSDRTAPARPDGPVAGRTRDRTTAPARRLTSGRAALPGSGRTSALALAVRRRG
jgi:anti-anti-sigma factor